MSKPTNSCMLKMLEERIRLGESEYGELAADYVEALRMAADYVDALRKVEDALRERMERKDGWIDVNDRMPPEFANGYATFNDLHQPENNLLRRYSLEVLVTLRCGNGSNVVTTGRTLEGVWAINNVLVHDETTVTHWMSFPEPPKADKKGENE